VPERDDAELVRHAITGNDAAYEELVARYRTRVFGTASRFARGKHELDDLAQDIFIRIWKGLPSYREEAPFEHWFMRIAVRTCYDFLRKHRRRRESEVLVDETPVDRNPATDSPDARIRQQREAWEVVQQLLECLNEKDRLVITLMDLEEKSVKETAALTGWSESNVKVRAHRARHKMRDIYEKRMKGRS